MFSVSKVDTYVYLPKYGSFMNRKWKWKFLMKVFDMKVLVFYETIFKSVKLISGLQFSTALASKFSLILNKIFRVGYIKRFQQFDTNKNNCWYDPLLLNDPNSMVLCLCDTVSISYPQFMYTVQPTMPLPSVRTLTEVTFSYRLQK